MKYEYQTPLKQALDEVMEQDRSRFHMPGHKGFLPEPLEQAAPYDLTEIEGTDSLYEASGPIRELEERIASCYDADATLISAGGSTLCIQTMLYLARQRGRKIIISRTVHRSAVAAMGLLGLVPIWVKGRLVTDPRDGIVGTTLPPTADEIEEVLLHTPDAVGVYVTSPDYFGQMCDIAALAERCHGYRTLLMVDNAHGAHLNRFRAAFHPMQLGADMCCDSFHKNLSVLTGGAALHLAKKEWYDEAKYAMSLFGSSSPSYLIMLSIDQALPEIGDRGDRMIELSERVQALRVLAEQTGFELVRTKISDPIKLTLGFLPLGYTKETFGAYVRAQGIEPEYLADNLCVFMPSLHSSERDLQRLADMIQNIERKPPIELQLRPDILPRRCFSISEAMARRQMKIPVSQAVSCVAARLISTCPPGTPVVVPGEEITSDTVEILRRAGIQEIFVVQ